MMWIIDIFQDFLSANFSSRVIVVDSGEAASFKAVSVDSATESGYRASGGLPFPLGNEPEIKFTTSKIAGFNLGLKVRIVG
ncbi:hypothetical protein [Nostoc sp.]|uniref:hypothetical protein n=1 Tax=Nostoc sp. TaxID=1180 RepID=UPI002FF74F38